MSITQKTTALHRRIQWPGKPQRKKKRNWKHSSVPVMVKLHLPSTLKKIETGAFYQANRLAYVYYNGSKEDWANVSIDSNSAIYINKAEFVTKD